VLAPVSVRLYVRPLQVGALSKRLHILSRKHQRKIAYWT